MFGQRKRKISSIALRFTDPAWKSRPFGLSRRSFTSGDMARRILRLTPDGARGGSLSTRRGWRERENKAPPPPAGEGGGGPRLEGWGWLGFWGWVPLSPRWVRGCEQHAPAASLEQPKPVA